MNAGMRSIELGVNFIGALRDEIGLAIAVRINDRCIAVGANSLINAYLNSVCAMAPPALGHWGTCPFPLDFQLFNFSGHFRAAQTLAFDSM